MMSNRALNWGLLSTARINKVLFEPLRASRRNRLLAVASRDKDRAETYAREKNIERAYGSYAELLADPDIDVVYNELPNHMHAEWTIKALEAGKHVLCEKPLALTLDDIDAVAAAAQKHNKVVTEGFMYRTHAQTSLIRDMVKNHKLGNIQMIRSSFTFTVTKEDDYRLKPEMGGGSLWDIGCYQLGFVRTVLAAEPQEVFGWQVTGSTGVDVLFAAQLRFPGNVLVQFNCGIKAPFQVFMEIVGDEAILKIPRPFNPKEQESLELTYHGKTDKIIVEGVPAYSSEVEGMADAILMSKPPIISIADSRANVAAILALFRSAESKKPVVL